MMTDISIVSFIIWRYPDHMATFVLYWPLAACCTDVSATHRYVGQPAGIHMIWEDCSNTHTLTLILGLSPYIDVNRISMAKCKTAVTPVHYCSLALSHPYNPNRHISSRFNPGCEIKLKSPGFCDNNCFMCTVFFNEGCFRPIWSIFRKYIIQKFR